MSNADELAKLRGEVLDRMRTAQDLLQLDKARALFEVLQWQVSTGTAE